MIFPAFVFLHLKATHLSVATTATKAYADSTKFTAQVSTSALESQVGKILEIMHEV